MIYVKNNTEPQTIYIPKDGDGVYIPSGGGGYSQGFADGRDWQKAQLTSGTFTENGDYFREDGWNEITIAVPQGDYAEGYADGVAWRDAQDIPGAFYENGTYRRENGYGWNEVNVRVDTASTYQSGYTEGYEARGELLERLEVSANNQTFTSETGWNEVVVVITGLTGGFTTTATTNGHYEYDAHDYGVAGWEQITIDVNVPQTGTTGTQIPLTAVTQETTLTQYGTYYFVYDQNTPTESLNVHFNSHITGDTGYTRVVYDVVDTVQPTKIMSYTSGTLTMSIDGGPEITPATAYTFNTAGQHTIEFKTKNNTTPHLSQCHTIIDIVVSNVNEIPHYSFWGTNITTFNVPDSVTKIGTNAFSGCGHLREVTGMNNVITLGQECFRATAISAITIPSNVDIIPMGFMNGCGNLTTLNLGNVSTIEQAAFAQNLISSTSLTSITIPNTVEYIGEDAFGSLDGLSELTIGNSVFHIDRVAFANSNLSTIYMYTIPPETDSTAFSNIPANGTVFFSNSLDRDDCYDWAMTYLPSSWLVAFFN